MRCRIAIALGAAIIFSVVPQATLLAQSAPPTYQGDPSVYKIIFENDSFRVIAATWKAGQADQPHSHPIASVVYALNDCKLTNPDGTTRDVVNKAGTATAAPITASHTAQNTGSSDCQVVFIERK